ICRIAERRKRGCALSGWAGAAAMPAVWASASVKITPGTSGSPGKCPANIGSSLENCVSHSAEMPALHAITFRTNTNGGRCGNPRKRPVTFASPVDEVGELPASSDPRDSNPVTIVIERRIGKLRRRDHKSAFFYESLRKNALYLRPKVFLLPILKNTGTRHRRIEFITKVIRHHRFEHLYIAFCYGFAKSAEERLEIDVGAFFAEVRLGLFLEFGLLEFFFFLLRRLAARKDECEREETGKQDSHQLNVCHAYDLDSRLDDHECVAFSGQRRCVFRTLNGCARKIQ